MELWRRCAVSVQHVLYALIPPQSSASQRYNLRHRTHSLQLPTHTPHACQTPTSSDECCIKTNIRHITVELLNYCMCFTYCALLVCVLTCSCNKQRLIDCFIVISSIVLVALLYTPDKIWSLSVLWINIKFST